MAARLPDAAAMIARYCALVAATVTATACSENNGWTITEGRTPSGVPHVVNTPPASGITQAWSFATDLMIGSVEESGPASFGTIKGLLVLPDERIVVLDAQAQELRIFTANGQPQHIFGRKGGGPGEFDDANGMVLGSDGLIRVNDPGNSRLSFFHPDSGFVKSVRLDVKMFGYTWGAVMDTADHIWENGLVMTADKGTYVLKGYQPDGQWTDTIPLRDRLDSGPSPGVYSYRTERGGTMMSVPFWPSPVSTMDPRHAFWRKPSHENDYRIVRTTFEGDTTLVFESRRPASPVSSSERDSAIARIKKRIPIDLDWSQIPNEKPIVTDLVVAENGDLWVKVDAQPGQSIFDVFGSNGRYKGTAAMPVRVNTYIEPVIREDRIWAVVWDELDVQHVARGRFTPVSAGR